MPKWCFQAFCCAKGLYFQRKPFAYSSRFFWGKPLSLKFTAVDLMDTLGEIKTDVNLVITWSRNPHAKTPIPGKPCKSGLIGVWHKDNLYLGTSTIGNGDPHPTNIDSQTRSIRMTPRRQLFFDKSFFSSLENHGREIISPTHTHTHTKCGKQEVLLIWIV
jgi:hypothetical protein